MSGSWAPCLSLHQLGICSSTHAWTMSRQGFGIVPFRAKVVMLRMNAKGENLKDVPVGPLTKAASCKDAYEGPYSFKALR